MSYGQVGWVIFLTGLPFAHFFLRGLGLDIYHAQTLWAQAFITVLAFIPGDCRKPHPTALGALFIWFGLRSLWLWTELLTKHGQYPTAYLLGAIHLVYLWLFYQAAQAHWTGEFLHILTKGICWASVAVMALCLMQIANLDHFHKPIAGPNVPDELVGTLGNPTHLGAYLSCALPLLLHEARHSLFWKAAAAVSMLLIILSGSQTALLAMALTVIWLCSMWNKRLLWLLIPALLLGAWLLGMHPESLNPHGRIAAWSEFWMLFQEGKPLMGLGLGFLSMNSRAMSADSILFGWRHAHNEFFQLAIELGLIGLGLFVWLLIDWTKQVSRLMTHAGDPRLIQALVGVGLAFLINCFLSWPMHLWTLGSFGLLAYCSIYVLAKEEF